MTRSSCLSTTAALAVVLLGFVPRTNAFSLSEWLANPPYSAEATVHEQIQCYTLPYGAIGFASHLLTYYTIICLTLGRSPVMPWAHLSFRRLNMLLAASGLIATLILTILGIVRCRRTWTLLLIAVWKLILSVTLSIMSFHAATLVVDRSYHMDTDPNTLKQFRKILYWLILYAAGTIVGMAGVGQLVRDHFDEIWELRTITYVFGGVVIAVPVGTLVVVSAYGLAAVGSLVWEGEEYYEEGHRLVARAGRMEGAQPERQFQNGEDTEEEDTEEEGKVRRGRRYWATWNTGAAFGAAVVGLAAMVVVVGTLFALYTDWVLAALAADWTGYPSRDNAALYWSYFVFKRFPLFSM